MPQTDYPWTPGPWTLSDTDIFGPNGEWITENGEGGGMQWMAEDCALIALAPEMAEAILAWENDGGQHGDSWTPVNMLMAVAEKLYKIMENS
jgi:hypothetical protein